jgi:glycosyltransferase involved in cell wall biosynthesis
MIRSAPVLALTRYGSRGASSRIRVLQYLPHLERLGIRVRACTLLSDAYLSALYSGTRPHPLDIARSYAVRLRDVIGADRGAVLWVEKELLPWLPSGLERWLLRRGQRLIVDCDDAVWLRYQQDAPAPLRALLRDKIEAMFARADAVTAGNRWIGAHALRAGARDVRLLPSVVDLDRYPAPSPRRPGTPCRIGWIGSPATVHYLRDLGPVLARLAAQVPIKVICFGGGPMRLDGVPVENLPWSPEREADIVGRFDIGVMPLRDGEWERGKCGYKLVQYLASGVPAVASRVGANPEILAEGDDGLLAGDDAEWLAALQRLAADWELRARMVEAGRRKVERLYSVQARVDEVAGLLRRVD